MLQRFVTWIIRLCIGLLILIIVAGSYVGNVAYQEFRTAQWDHILGIENHTRDVLVIHQWEAAQDWEAVHIMSTDGLVLRGTYIENSVKSSKTVILLHGLYQNRSMCLPYVSMYRNLGYNVLLIDQRGHGDSGGDHTDWGLSEVDDIAGWVQWLKRRNPNMQVGLHGISLGAAMALLYAGSSHGNSIAFVVSDSAYGNIISLGREKLFHVSGDQRAIWGYNILDVFFQGAMFFHTHKLVTDIEPAQAVRSVTVPILFLHGADDQLVPVKTARSLYDQCGSADKYLHIFADSPHAVGLETDKREYIHIVTAFLEHAEH